MRNRWIFVVLFLILGALTSARIYHISTQSSVSAQSAACSSGQIDILEYMMPSEVSGGGSGQRYTISGCYADPTSGEVVTGYSDDIQVIAKPITGEPNPQLSEALAQTGFISEKGEPGELDDEWWFYDDNYVYLYEDKSWNNQCEGGDRAFYREQNNLSGSPQWGGPYKRCMTPKTETASATHIYVSYNRQSENACDADFGEKDEQGNPIYSPTLTQGMSFQVSIAVDGEGNFTESRFEEIAPAIRDTIVIELVGGPGAGEMRFYSKGFGLTGYYAAVAGNVNFHVRSSEDGATLPTACDPTTPDTTGLRRKTNDFNIVPTIGLPEALVAKDRVKAGAALAMNDYKAKCVAQFSVGTVFGGAVDAWLAQHEGETINIDDIENQETFSAEKGTIPFIRGNTENPSQTASIENLLSVQDGVGQDVYEARQAVAANVARMTLEQQFYYKERNLINRKAICDYYTNEVGCPLWTPQPGYIHDMEDTLSYLWESGLDSRALAKPYSAVANQTTISETEFEGLRERMDEVPFNLERAVDLNYIVLIKELPKDEEDPLKALFPFLYALTERFHFINPLSPDEVKADPYGEASGIPKRDTVAAIAFPVPAYGIRTYPEAYIEWPHWMHKRGLQPDKLNQADQAKVDADREVVQKQVALMQSIPYDSDKRNINAMGKAFFAPDGGYDPMTMALTDIGDAAAGACQGLVAEPAQNIKFDTTYTQSPQFVTEKEGFDMHDDLFTLYAAASALNPQSAITRMLTTAFLGEEAGDIRTINKPYVKVVWVTRYPVDPVPDWSENITDSFLAQEQIDSYKEDLADYHNATALVGDDPAQIAAVTGEKKIFGDVVPYKKDVALENFYDWGSEVETVPFEDETKCQYDDAGNLIPGSCSNFFTVSVVAETPGVGAGDVGKIWNAPRLWPLFAFAQNSAQSAHARASANPEEYLQGTQALPSGGSNGTGSTPGESGTRPEAVAQCTGGARITSGETAVHYCASSGQQCTPRKGECTVMDSSLTIANWKNSNDATIDCAALVSYSACTYPGSLVANPVTPQGQFTETSSVTACEYVVQQAKAAGVSPRLALAVWGEESGFGSVGGAMFGYRPGVNDFDLAFQVNGFLSSVKAAGTYEDFMLKYSSLKDLNSRQFCTNPHWPGRVKTFYDYLGPR